jgi:hypothetical protein
VHEQGSELHRLANDQVEFRTPRGQLLHEAPAPPRQPIDPFEALVKRLEDGAVVVDPYTGTPLWDGSPPDLGLAVEWFLAKTCKKSPAVRLSLGGTVVHRAALPNPKPYLDWHDPWQAAVRGNDFCGDES